MSVGNDVDFTLGKDSDDNLVVQRQYILHTCNCQNSDEDVAIMKYKIEHDRACLSRKIYSPSYSDKQATALMDALKSNHDKCVLLMIKNGADINEIDEYSELDIIKYCIKFDKFKVFKLLIENNIINGIYNRDEYSEIVRPNYYLYFAVSNLKLNFVHILLKYGVPVDTFENFEYSLNDYLSNSPTIFAIEEGMASVLKLLLLHGGAVDIRQIRTGYWNGPIMKDAMSLIHHFAATAFNHYDVYIQILNILYEFGSNLWEKNRHGFNPLQVREDIRSIVLATSDRGNKVQLYYAFRNCDVTNKITEKMRELMGKPLRLKSLVRVSIIKAKGAEYLNYVEALENEIPKEVIQFLRADDLEANDL